MLRHIAPGFGIFKAPPQSLKLFRGTKKGTFALRPLTSFSLYSFIFILFSYYLSFDKVCISFSLPSKDYPSPAPFARDKKTDGNFSKLSSAQI